LSNILTTASLNFSRLFII